MRPNKGEKRGSLWDQRKETTELAQKGVAQGQGNVAGASSHEIQWLSEKALFVQDLKTTSMELG